MKTRSTTYLMIGILGVLSCAAFAQTDEVVKKIDFWASSGLTLEQAIDQIEPGCTTTPDQLVGCLQALDVLGGMTKPQSMFATDAEAAAVPEQFSKLIKSYGAISLYEFTKPKKSLGLTDLNKIRLAMREARAQGAVSLLNTTSNAKVDIRAILTEMSPKVFRETYANAQALIAGDMINAYLQATLDPHTHLDSVAEDQEELAGNDDSYAGIGVSIQEIAGKVIIKIATENGPAIKAGIRANDEFVSVDGQNVEGKTMDEVTKLVRGSIGTDVSVGIRRKNQLLTFKIVRAKIVTANIETNVLNDFGKTVGYIRLRSFMDQTGCTKIEAAIRKLEAQRVSGLIFDLRGNGGGLVDQAVCIGGLFVGQKTIVQEKNLKTGKMQKSDSTHVQITKLPLVTLISADSASASEIVSGALQDYQRSWILGERSFGKATVQGPGVVVVMDHGVASQELDLYHDAVTNAPIAGITKFGTIARFYQPSGRTNQIVGITPDYEVYPMPNPTADDKFATREADLFTNALGAIGVPWKNPRAAKSQKLATCISTNRDVIGRYKALQDTATPRDLQILSSEAAIGCDQKVQ